MYDTASKCYNEILENYFNEYEKISDAKARKINLKCESTNLMLTKKDYKGWFTEKESADTTLKEEFADLPPMLPLEGNAEVKEGMGIKI